MLKYYTTWIIISILLSMIVVTRVNKYKNGFYYLHDLLISLFWPLTIVAFLTYISYKKIIK